MILVGTQVGNIGILVKTLQPFPNEETRNQAIKTFLQSTRLRVFDME